MMLYFEGHASLSPFPQLFSYIVSTAVLIMYEKSGDVREERQQVTVE
jgi:hypothetical protein